MGENRAAAVAAVLLAVVLAVLGLRLFWTSVGADGAGSVAIGVLGLVVGLAAAVAAGRRVLRLLLPGVLERVEHDERLEASAGFREPGPFSVVLDSPGSRTIDVVKVIRDVTGSDLRRAKELIDAAPALVVAGVSEESAERVVERLHRAGGSVRVQEDRDGPTGPPTV